jgi:hypothetical protein
MVDLDNLDDKARQEYGELKGKAGQKMKDLKKDKSSKTKQSKGTK